MATHWAKGQSVKLVPNPMYWGTKPNFSSVTFDFITDTAAEQQDFKSGQVLAVYPQAQPGQEALKGQPGTYFDAITGLSYEGLWFNIAKAPLNDQAVRQALGYATDRDGHRQPAVRPDPAGHQADPELVHAGLRQRSTATPFAKYQLDPKHGHHAHDGRRLDQGFRRDLGQGRAEGGAGAEDDHGQQAPAADRPDPPEPSGSRPGSS